MRTPFFIRVLALTFVFSTSALAADTEITKQQAENICKGKQPNSNGEGCNWCGKINCTSVNCDEKKCNLTIVSPNDAEMGGQSPPAKPKAPGGALQTPPGILYGQ